MLSTTFAANTGADATLVFDGTIALSTAVAPTNSAPKNFDVVIPLQTPFPYDPAQGNLLLDLRNRSDLNFFMADTVELTGDGTSRVVTWAFSPDPQTADSPTGLADSGGLVTRFSLPEPSGQVRAVAATLALGVLARRRRRTPHLAPT